MPRSTAEILAPARAEITRGRPRAALRELEAAREELLAAADAGGLGQALELVRGVRTLAPADTKTRERLLATFEQDLESLSPRAVAGTAEKAADSRSPTPFIPYGGVSTEQLLAPARAEIANGNTGRALRALEKARRKLINRSEIDGLGELLELALRLPITKTRHEQSRRRLIEAARQNVRFLSRRSALESGEEWSEPFTAAAKPERKLPTLPPMTRREKLIAAAFVALAAAVISAWALVNRAPQRAVHAIKCPTGEQGSPTWSPDGKEIAFAKNRECGTQITVVTLEDGRLRTVSSGYGVLPDWSPDGRTILYRSRDGFSVVPPQGGKSRLLRSDDGVMGASWSPDGELIAFVHGLAADPELDEEFRSTLYTMRPDGSEVRRLLGHSCNPRTPKWSPKGDYLILGCDDGIYDLALKGDSPTQIVRLSLSTGPISVSASPDGRRLAFGWVGLETVPTDGSANPTVLAAIDNSYNATIDVAWAPDGKRIAFSVTESGSDDGLYVVDADGSHRRRLVAF